MGRISDRFQRLRSEGRKALIPFITAGDPHPQHTVLFLHALVDAGADVLELGVPFSDPMADGPVIQLADERSLLHGTTLKDVLGMVKEFRTRDSATPVVLMGYLNPMERYGYDQFAADAAEAGVDGVLTVDLPPEAADGFNARLRGHGIDSIFLMAPTTRDDRIALIASKASGYLYYVSLKGVTGAGNLDVESVRQKLETIRNSTDLPVAVGFGIKDAESASQIGALADGVVVGSALVNLIAARVESPEEIAPALGAFLGTLRVALDNLR